LQRYNDEMLAAELKSVHPLILEEEGINDTLQRDQTYFGN